MPAGVGCFKGQDGLGLGHRIGTCFSWVIFRITFIVFPFCNVKCPPGTGFGVLYQYWTALSQRKDAGRKEFPSLAPSLNSDTGHGLIVYDSIRITQVTSIFPRHSTIGFRYPNSHRDCTNYISRYTSITVVYCLSPTEYMSMNTHATGSCLAIGIHG